jgi:hypothetical protein
MLYIQRNLSCGGRSRQTSRQEGVYRSGLVTLSRLRCILRGLLDIVHIRSSEFARRLHRIVPRSTPVCKSCLCLVLPAGSGGMSVIPAHRADWFIHDSTRLLQFLFLHTTTSLRLGISKAPGSHSSTIICTSESSSASCF